MTFFSVLENRMPHWSVNIGIIFLITTVIVVVLAKSKKPNKKQWLLGGVLYIYTFNVLVTTLLMRESMGEHLCDLSPVFLIGIVYNHGVGQVFYEIILNFFMLLPIGLILPYFLKNERRFLTSALIGSSLSLFIEITQFAAMIGVMQTEDFIANSLGAFVGAFISWCVFRKRAQKLESGA